MKKILMFVWIIAATIFLGRWFLSNPEYSSIFNSFWKTVDSFVKPQGQENAHDLWLLMVVVMSFLIVLFFTWFLVLIHKKVKI